MKNKMKIKNQQKMNKKAEPVGTATIEILILIASIAVIFLFWSAFNWNSTIDKKACHQSIILRSSFNMGFLEVSKNAVPLKCQTEKICLGGNCESNFGKATKENLVTKVKLDQYAKVSKQEILDTIANSMYDCHSMLGEGKLNFMPRKGFTQDYCLICSIFVLDNSTKEIPQISYPDLYKYMETKKNSDGMNYLEYIYGVKTASEMNQNIEELRITLNKNQINQINSINDLKINLSSENSIIVKLSPRGTWSAVVKGGVVAGAIIAIPITGGASLVAVGAAVVAGGSIGGVVYTKTFPEDSDYEYSPPSIYVYDVQSLQSLKCSSFETAP